jgi:hypothetical protein
VASCNIDFDKSAREAIENSARRGLGKIVAKYLHAVLDPRSRKRRAIKVEGVNCFIG